MRRPSEQKLALQLIAESRASLARASILLIDDKPDSSYPTRPSSSGLGVQCVPASSGLSALERLQSQEFAGILLDVKVPGMGRGSTSKYVWAE